MIFTNRHKLHAIEREIQSRRVNYGKLVDQGKMTGHKMAFEVKVMEAIARDYQKLVAEEEAHAVPGPEVTERD